MLHSFQGILIKHRLDDSTKQSKKAKSCGREKASTNLIIKHSHIGLCTDERLVILGLQNISLLHNLFHISVPEIWRDTTGLESIQRRLLR